MIEYIYIRENIYQRHANKCLNIPYIVHRYSGMHDPGVVYTDNTSQENSMSTRNATACLPLPKGIQFN